MEMKIKAVKSGFKQNAETHLKSQALGKPRVSKLKIWRFVLMAEF